MIRSQTEMLAQAEAQSRTMSTLLWSIAGVSLLVGRHRNHEHHARLRDGADPRDRRAHGDRGPGRRHPRPVPRGGRRARARGRLGRDRARARDPALRREGRGVAGRRSSRPRSASRSPSRRSSASRSGSTRRSRRAGWTPSKPSGTSSVNLSPVSSGRPGTEDSGDVSARDEAPHEGGATWSPRRSLGARLVLYLLPVAVLPALVYWILVDRQRAGDEQQLLETLLADAHRQEARALREEANDAVRRISDTADGLVALVRRVGLEASRALEAGPDPNLPAEEMLDDPGGLLRSAHPGVSIAVVSRTHGNDPPRAPGPRRDAAARGAVRRARPRPRGRLGDRRRHGLGRRARGTRPHVPGRRNGHHPGRLRLPVEGDAGARAAAAARRSGSGRLDPGLRGPLRQRRGRSSPRRLSSVRKTAVSSRRSASTGSSRASSRGRPTRRVRRTSSCSCRATAPSSSRRRASASTLRIPPP